MSKTEPSVTLRGHPDGQEAPLVNIDPSEEPTEEKTWFSDAVPSPSRRSPFAGGKKIGMG